MKEQKYREQYCKIHDQHYADFLHECPICRGERTECAKIVLQDTDKKE